jgi:hypothetical protein
VDQTDNNSVSYAIRIADDSYDWYMSAARKARFYHRLTASATQAIAAAIPVAAAIAPRNAIVPAFLGGAIVVLGGLRSLFDWQENYIRFTEARESVEAERRLYRTNSPPYDDPATNEQVLVTAVTRIEREEMRAWFEIANDDPRKTIGP